MKKAFLCVIRSCFDAKDVSDPAIFKIKSDFVDKAYYYRSDMALEFGQTDVTVLMWGHRTDSNHTNSYFDGGLHGNRLCGGSQYETEPKSYTFDIVKWNTFTIKIND